MKEQSNTLYFLTNLVEEIEKKDKLHSRNIKVNIAFLNENYPNEFNELVGLVNAYFINLNLSTEQIAIDYLKMIKDMRIEGLYFYKHGKYRCENQDIANEYVYSKPDVMNYYMNALLVSQILWKHHFMIFMYFLKKLPLLLNNKTNLSILDIGPGHGFFSFLIKKEFPNYNNIDIVDISPTSLKMTEKIIGTDNNKIQYYLNNIFEYSNDKKYDFIVLGEVLEHLDYPKDILIKLSTLLNPNGLLWLTTPTNAPALDHVYLFKTKEEILQLIENAELKVVDVCNYFAEDTDEETALKNNITNLVGVFCSNK